MEIIKIQKESISKSKAILNIIDLYLDTPTEHRKIYKNWYYDANEKLSELAFECDMDIKIVSAVCSILSPAVNWEQNLIDCERLIIRFVNDMNIDDLKVSTYGQNKNKAIKLLNDTIDMVPTTKELYKYVYGTGANKTANFFMNLLEPNNHNFITIDRHAIKIMLNSFVGGAMTLTTKNYIKATEAYKKAFEIIKHIDNFITVPNQVQAITWEQYRKVRREIK